MEMNHYCISVQQQKIKKIRYELDCFLQYNKTIAREKLLPCVVFCFSKVQTEDVPRQLDESIDFTDGEEKGRIKAFLKQKIQRLSDTDQKLPQIESLSSLLVRGIGVHNAGMLPFTKEVVEILFADGLLKIVFATTTFAIGLNMPARSVLFTKVFKFSGGENEELVETSEYLQMAGRAGRRGKDPTGSCLIVLDRSFGRQIPDEEDFDRLLENKGTPLESKLKLSYSMTMNVLRSESMLIDDMLKASWYENEAEKEKATKLKDASKLQILINKCHNIECTHGCQHEQIAAYETVFNEIIKKNRSIFVYSKISICAKCIVECMSPELFMEKAIVLRPSKDNSNLILLYLRKGGDYPPRYVPPKGTPDHLTSYQPPRRGQIKGIYYEYLDIDPKYIGRIYDVLIEQQVTLNNKGELSDRQITAIAEEYFSIKHMGEWQKLDRKCTVYIRERAELIRKLSEMKLPHNCPSRNLHLGQQVALLDYQEQYLLTTNAMSTISREKMEDFNAKVKVFIDYGYFDKELNLLFKGKVANAIQSTDKILTTELIFSGLLKDMTVEECIALFSVLNVQVKAGRKTDPCAGVISPNFQNALLFLDEQCKKLIEVEKKMGVIETEPDPEKRLNFHFYELMHAWASKAPFIDIVKANPTIDDGSIVKMVNSVERICMQVKTAARGLEDATLAKRMDEASTLIKRDIIFTPSLYLE